VRGIITKMESRSAPAKKSKLDVFDEEDSYGSDADDDVRSLVQQAGRSEKNSLKNDKGSQRKQQSPTDVVSAVVKKKREVTSLTPANLLGEKGFANLQQRFTRFTPSSAGQDGGNELGDLTRMMKIYEAWAEDLQVREGADWPDFVEKLDRLKKVEIRKAIQHAREGDLKNSFMRRMQENEMVKVNVNYAETTGSQTLAKPAQPHASPSTQSTMPPPSSDLPAPRPPLVPNISEDMKAFIEKKKLEALKRREERLKQNKPSSDRGEKETSSENDTQPTQKVFSEGDSQFSEAPTQLVEAIHAPDRSQLESSQETPTQLVDAFTASQIGTQDPHTTGTQEQPVHAEGEYADDSSPAPTQLVHELSPTAPSQGDGGDEEDEL